MREKIASLHGRLAGGVLPATATPLHDDGYTVNAAVVPDLVDFLIEAQVRGLFVGGTTGEGILLAPRERVSLHELALAAAAGRVPVLLHVGANTTAEAVALARHAASLPADAIVVITPTFYPMGDDALLAYFTEVGAAAPEIPLLVYDIPQMAVNGISPELLARLADALPNFAGIKCSRPDAQMIRRLIDAAAPGVGLYAGNEAIALGSLALGAHALISGLATAVPEPFVALTGSFARSNLAAAQEEQRRVNRLLALLPAGARIGGMKRILQQRGLPVGPCVPPRAMPETPLLWKAMQEVLA
ncbi:MAG: dihydrodipicolinate synthase family protein [Anaerolineae bacterium]|nr:dihydrodipicolinate synthase family protein [Anaerolineae bacterium]